MKFLCLLTMIKNIYFKMDFHKSTRYSFVKIHLKVNIFYHSKKTKKFTLRWIFTNLLAIVFPRYESILFLFNNIMDDYSSRKRTIKIQNISKKTLPSILFKHLKVLNFFSKYIMRKQAP